MPGCINLCIIVAYLQKCKILVKRLLNVQFPIGRRFLISQLITSFIFNYNKLLSGGRYLYCPPGILGKVLSQMYITFQTLFEEIIKTMESGGKAARVTTTVGYTKEQAEAIQRLVNAKDNYERLGLHLGASRLELFTSVRTNRSFCRLTSNCDIYYFMVSSPEATPSTK